MHTDSATGRAATHAWEWLQERLGGRPVPSLVIVIGLGDGALLHALDAHARGTRVLAFETDPGAAAAFRRADWQGWQERLTYLAAPDYAGEADAWRVFPADPEDHVVLVDPAVSRAATPMSLAAAHALKRIVYGARANAEARRRFAPRYLLNALRNVPAIARGRDLAEITNAYAGHAAVIVAAGPSLDRSIADLRALEDRALVIAVDTALRPLLAAGVEPHLVVGLDPGEANARHFRALPPAPDTWLISEAALDPVAHAQFAGRTLWFRVSDHDPWPWLRSHGLDVQQLDVWGSVVTAAFQVAVRAGCDPIVFVGADLSHEGRQPYCRGTTYEFQWAEWAANGTLVEDAWLAWLANATREVPDVTGSPRRTTPALLAFRDWLVSRAASSGRRVVNASRGGLLIGGGIVQATLDDAVSPGGRVPRLAHVLTQRPAKSGGRVWRGHVAAVHADMAAGRDTDVLASWRRFIGSAWDPAAIAAALDAAEHEFDRHGAVTPASAMALHLPHGILPRLPEWMHRWHLWLHGHPPGDARLAGPDRDTCLAHAFRLLIELSGRLKDSGIDVVTQRVARVETTPLAIAYEWPEPFAWIVTAMEGLLAAACASDTTPQARDFFGRRPETRADETDEETQDGYPRPRPVDEVIAVLALRLCHVHGAASPIDPGLLIAATAHTGAADYHHDATTHTVRVRVEDSTGSAVTDVPLHVRSSSLGRLHTGLVCAPTSGATSTTAPDADWLPAGQCRSAGDAGTIVVSALGRVPEAVGLLRPRVLALAPERRAYVSYGAAEGVVCVVPGASESVLLRPGGAMEPYVGWPRPIVGQLLAGDRIVAWSNGTAAWEDPLLGYVMWQDASGGGIGIRNLPFRPSSGVWWNGGVYWTCVEPGLGAWEPEGEPRRLPDDSTFLSIEPRGDHLAAIPLRRGVDGRVERRVAGHEMLMEADGRTTRQPLGPLGPRTSAATGHQGVTAEAYPHADTVLLRRGSRPPLRLVCYYPVRLAWLDDSLVVSTLDGDLLLFEGLAAWIDRLAAAS